MNYRKLGNTSIEISEISFGCSSLEHNREKSINLIHKAFDKGINFFDTSDLYDKGWNEETVGTALKEIRNEVFISTKVGNRWRPDGSGWDWVPSRSYILSAVEDSLKRLKTDRIDLYMLHGGTIEDPIDEIIDAFEQLVESGKIRCYGISSIRPNVIREYLQRSRISSVMMQYSLLDRRPEESCLDLIQESGVSVLTRGSLAKGLLIDKPAADYLGYSAPEVKEMKQAVANTANPVGASLQFVMNHPAVTSVVAGIRTAGQLDEVIHSFHPPISEETLEELRKVVEPKFYEKHR